MSSSVSPCWVKMMRSGHGVSSQILPKSVLEKLRLRDQPKRCSKWPDTTLGEFWMDEFSSSSLIEDGEKERMPMLQDVASKQARRMLSICRVGEQCLVIIVARVVSRHHIAPSEETRAALRQLVDQTGPHIGDNRVLLVLLVTRL